MPDFKAEIRARLAELRLPPVREAEIVDEFSQHLTDQYEAAINRGASEEEARQAVFQELNASEFFNREKCEVARVVGFAEAQRGDLAAVSESLENAVNQWRSQKA